MNERKTTRKNKTNQVINWPNADEYFTIKELVELNKHMLTSATKGADITIRVRLSKAIEDKKIASIGSIHCDKGRPQLVFTQRPVSQLMLDKAKANGIMLVEESKIIEIMQINSTPSSSPVTNILKKTETVPA
jgi:hypothetical protein